MPSASVAFCAFHGLERSFRGYGAGSCCEVNPTSLGVHVGLDSSFSTGSMSGLDGFRLLAVHRKSLRAFVAVVALTLMTLPSGCSRMRLPAIDPSGQRLFQPLPNTTPLTWPNCFGRRNAVAVAPAPIMTGPANNAPVASGTVAAPGPIVTQGPAYPGAPIIAQPAPSGPNCFQRFSQSLRNCSLFPKPAYATPPEPPACPTAAPTAMPGTCPQPVYTDPCGEPACPPLYPAPACPPTASASPTPAAPVLTTAPVPNGIYGERSCVPSAPCTAECAHGPPAVLIGSEINRGRTSCLAKKGVRGRILLSPQKIVAPVNGEVILLSGICGADGYLQTGQPLEWMLTPESVGTFIEVGDEGCGVAHRLANIRSPKKDPSYAIGVTSTKRTLITRGNLKTGDDVILEKGQTWISLSSPSEGTSRVTVLAPDSDCWDQRKTTATIYWVDAKRTFPGTQIVPAGQQVTLSTRVTRSDADLPARGWRVRYEIIDPSLATFANTAGSSVTEAVVDDQGNAAVTLLPTPGTAGTTAVMMSVVRPGGESDNMPNLTLFSGQTYVTWSAPKLLVNLQVPQVIGFQEPFQAVLNVQNPGDQAANNVRVQLRFPEGIRATTNDPLAKNLTNSIVWELGTLPAGQQIDLAAQLVTPTTIALLAEARADNGLVSQSEGRVSVFRPSLSVVARPLKDRVEVGEPIPFAIDVRNVGDRPLTDVSLLVSGDASMTHEGGSRSVTSNRTLPLQPGDTWRSDEVIFRSVDAGQHCMQVEATAAGGQREQTQACVTVVNQPVPTPSLTTQLTIPQQVNVGESTTAKLIVANDGRVPLTNLIVTLTHDPQLVPVESTERSSIQKRALPGQYQVQWAIPQLNSGTSEAIDLKLRANGINPRSTIYMNVQSDQGSFPGKQVQFAINSGVIPAPPAPTQPPNLPPVQPTPSIPPNNSAPLTNNGLQPNNPPPALPVVPNTPPATPGPQAQQLELKLQGPTDPVFVQFPMRYELTVRNPRTTPVSNVGVQISKPAGINVTRITMLDGRPLDRIQQKNDRVSWQLGTLQGGEAMTFEIMLSSNLPQAFRINARAVAQEMDLGAQATTEARVVPVQ